VPVLERLSTGEADQVKLLQQVLQSELVTEAMILSTCNRVEVYAVVDAFHGGLSAIGQVLAEHSGMSMSDITKHAYVRYSEAAVEHLFAVASGLDSAVLGEQQVLGQVRRAYATAEANQTVGRVLHDLSQRALAVGKRVHSETSIDAAGASVVSVALDIAAERLAGIAGRSATVIGAGSMGGLSAAHLIRAGVSEVHVVNRSLPRAERLAQNIVAQGVPARAFALDDLPAAIAAADGLAVTQAYLGLHLGEVLYGNIGSRDRLDFTVVGRAVNEVARIEAMCRSLEQRVIVSEAFAASAGAARERLVSVGRYALRGGRRPEELFTLDGER